MLTALASASAIGIAATPAELQRGRLMRAPDHDFSGPTYFYGPKGESAIFESANDVPAGWLDHPSKHKNAAPADSGTKTAVQPANTTVDAKTAAKTTTAESQTQTDPKTAAKTGTADGAASGTAQTPAAGKPVVDAHGHPHNPEIHAATASQTKDGLWRMKVGVKRPDPLPGYPLDL
jgi:hypothetical protein